MASKTLIIYQTSDGREPFREWITGFRDNVTRARIERRLEKIEQGNYGDYKSVGEGVFELRYFFGASYRIYFAEDGDTLVLLLDGGDKSGQRRDIARAQEYWKDYQAEKSKQSTDDPKKPEDRP